MVAMLDQAVEAGALVLNPVRGSLSMSRPAPDHRSLTVAELETVRAAVRAWLRKERSGPRSSGDIADIIEVISRSALAWVRFSLFAGLTST